MEAAMPVAPAASQKRPLDEDAEPSTPNKRTTASTTSTPLSVLSVSTPSPLKAQATGGLVDSNPSIAGDGVVMPQPVSTASSVQPAKRRKFTAQEKEDQRLKKEADAKARAEKKQAKEAADKLKAEQKEEKKRAKELKQQQEDEIKRKKEEEKQKKERSQMKLNAFFLKPKSAEGDEVKSTKTIQKDAKSDYQRYFLPFSLPPQAILAPHNAFMEDPEARSASRLRMEKLVAQEESHVESMTLEDMRALFPKRRRGLETATISQVVDMVNGSASRPIDLTGSSNASQLTPLDMLKQIPMKYLCFPEDVRPPYYGTYTKPHAPAHERKLARNPSSRGLDDLNYDYDSEAEWEEPEEGEDLGSEGEEDVDEDGDEDMDGFLDDDDDLDFKRRLLSGDQEPISSGLCWEDPSGVSILNDGSGAICTEFKDFRMGFLLDPQPQSIDPFSTAYWAPEPAPTPVPFRPTIKDFASNGPMDPPRLLLTSRPVNGLLANAVGASAKAAPNSGAKAVKPKRTIPSEQLPAFKAEVEGQDLTKIAMIEALKKKFPDLPKDAITNTLSQIAKRQGPSEKEKRWTIVA